MRRAALAIEERRSDGNFGKVFSSPLIRASEGARIMVARRTHRLSRSRNSSKWHHFGLFEGLTADEIRERYPDHFSVWNADRLAPDYTYPEGESRANFASRVERGLDRVLAI